MISFELKKPRHGTTADELEIFLDREGLESLLAQLGSLDQGRTEHIHLMAESWGGHDLTDKPYDQENTIIHHVKIYLR